MAILQMTFGCNLIWLFLFVSHCASMDDSLNRSFDIGDAEHSKIEEIATVLRT